MRRLGIPARLAGWIAIGFAIGIAVGVIAPRALGGQSYTVMSGSMEPTIGTGDVVVNERIAPVEARVGDVVTFRDPRDQSRLVTHRLRSVTVRDGAARMVTKGDANNTVETWNVPMDGEIGRVRYRVPKLGYLLSPAGGKGGRLLLIVIPALLLAGLELVRIRRPKREEEPHAA